MNKKDIKKNIKLTAKLIIEKLKENKYINPEFMPNLKKSKINKITMEKLQYEEIGKCNLCELHKKRTNIVFGEGSLEAKLMIIGEAPGKEEDLNGKPFLGQSGDLLNRMIKAMNLDRSDIYICNVVKCKPPSNRDPTKKEISICEIFLKNQISIIKPKIIIALGNHACMSLLKTNNPISKIRGIWKKYENILIMPTFHPAYLLRNNDKKKESWHDLKRVIKMLKI